MKPEFLTQPGAWATKRTDQSAADLACAIERPADGGHASDLFILAAGLVALCYIIAGVL